ncbi:hypothetical protein DFH94DRAFT_285422 [Russula ochroleuca]|uniref:RlpA-like protein double-psi beta-barrel domain-containing protein n=1 Tax=Russula ochroleuca TaxID=152965 RepID=A0A9P5JX67_9AGAM|nr:hypothetical protein DFH94DRAFT_285422 [Russula ochroleuca]
MYNLTLVPLFALFSLVFAIPKPGPEKIDELERRDGQIFIGQAEHLPVDLYGLTTISGCGPPNIYAPVVGISLAIHKYTLNCNDPEIVEIVYDSTVINATIVYDCPGCGDSGIVMSDACFQELGIPQSTTVTNVLWSYGPE